MQCKEKLMKQNMRKVWARFWPVLSTFGLPNFFSWVLPLLVVRQNPKLLSYVIYRQTNKPKHEKMAKKTPNIGPTNGPILIFMGFISTRC